jgi:hypothetical protein
MRILPLLFAAFMAAAPSRGDTLTDVKAALARFRGREPLRASYAVERQMSAEGRFANNRTSSAVAVEVTRSAEGVSVTIPEMLLERAADEGRTHSGSFKNETRNAIYRISPLAAADGLNYAPAFSGLLLMASLKEERRETRNAQAVRRLTLDIHQPMTKNEGIEIGDVKTVEDRLTLWIGDDNVPLAGRRTRKIRAGFLFLHGETEETDDWTFSRNGDSLVLTRHEHAMMASGMGQRGSGKTVETMVVH